MDCKFCQSKNVIKSKEIISPINELSYYLWLCNSCHNSFFDENQHQFELNILYNDLAQNRGLFPIEFVPNKIWEGERRNIINVLGHYPNSILDVGCRTGDFLMHFDPNIRLSGIEISKQFAEIGIQRGLDIYNDLLENLNFTEKYEVVTCYAILEHLQNPIHFISRLYNVLQQGGLLVVMIPSLQTFKAKLSGQKWHMFSPPEHLNYFSRKFLDLFLIQKSFQLKRRYYTSGGMLLYSGKNKIIIKSEAFLNYLINNSFFNRLPIFDHMYSYYIRR